jgi:hypothetical protein
MLVLLIFVMQVIDLTIYRLKAVYKEKDCLKETLPEFIFNCIFPR